MSRKFWTFQLNDEIRIWNLQSSIVSISKRIFNFVWIFFRTIAFKSYFSCHWNKRIELEIRSSFEKTYVFSITTFLFQFQSIWFLKKLISIKKVLTWYIGFSFQIATGTEDSVSDLLFYNQTNLFVAGYFHSAGNKSETNKIASWSLQNCKKNEIK